MTLTHVWQVLRRLKAEAEQTANSRAPDKWRLLGAFRQSAGWSDADMNGALLEPDIVARRSGPESMICTGLQTQTTQKALNWHIHQLLDIVRRAWSISQEHHEN
jgi:hypothetical protein